MAEVHNVIMLYMFQKYQNKEGCLPVPERELEGDLVVVVVVAQLGLKRKTNHED